MKLFKGLVIALIAVAVAFVVIGFLLPKTRHLERSVVIDAPPCVVFARVNGFRHFNDWSPFVAVMPEATYSFDGPDFGVGSEMTWSTGEPDAQRGGQTIVASTPYERVEVELDLGPEGKARSAYLLTAVDTGTRLTWAFDVDFGIDLPARYWGLLLDRQLGPLYAQGLTNLKRICEELPKIDWSDIEIEITEVPSTTIAYTSGSAGGDATDIAAALAAAYGQVVSFVTGSGLQLTGHPLAITNYRDERGWSFDAGLPVTGGPSRGVGPDAAVRMGETYGGRVVRAVHVGPYNALQATYDKVEAFMTVHKLEANGRPWDVWVSDPGSVPEGELITEVYYPVK